MTEEKTFTVARGEVIRVNSVESQDRSSYSATIKFFNESGTTTFHSISEERFHFFRDAMRNGKIVSFPDIQPGEYLFVYDVKKCFISDEQKEQESPLTGQKES